MTMTMTADHAAPQTLADDAERALALACGAGHMLRDLSQRVHPLWIASLGAELEACATHHPALLDELLLSRFDLRWPDLSAASLGAEYLWLLPPQQVRQLCCARALYGWRDALNRCVDGQVRRQARVLVGDVAFKVLIARPDRRPHSTALPPSLHADEVCTLGWTQLKTAWPWRDARARRLVDLMLPPAPAAAEPAPGSDDDHPLFMADLLAMFPEHAWLFG